ncbi:MAG: hypothetical protein ABI867_27395 [Kofleriaceae bacterium]
MRLALPIALVLAVLPRAASADPSSDRVFTAPTAWLPPAGGVVATGSVDLREVFDARLESGLVIGIGLGGIAAVDVGVDTDLRACTSCDDTKAVPIYLGRASFRLGARQDLLFRGQPALLAGVRTSFAASGSFRDVKVTEAYLVASRVLGPVRLHAGVAILDAGFTDTGPADADVRISLGPTPTPIAGIELTPKQYPKTTLMADLTYSPKLERGGGGPAVTTEFVAGWGVRYQAFGWGAIDLAIRYREDDELGDATVLMRLTGVWR